MPLEGEAKREYNKLAYQKKKELEKYVSSEESKVYPPGEFLTTAELYKVFKGADYRTDPEESDYIKKKKKRIINPSELEIFGSKRTFEEWLGFRRQMRADEWFFWNTLTEKRGKWYEKTHRPLERFFVKKDNTTLPGNYTQDQLNKWLLEQDTQHDRLLLYPRAFRKSSANMLDGIHWIINAPDIILLFITATKALGYKFVKELRSYFSIVDYDRPTHFQILFSEFCFKEGDGDSREYRCPIAHLALKDATVSYSSMESSTAGVRAMVLKLDDAQDEENFKTVDSRLDLIEKFDAAAELVVRPYGYVDVIGTRYTDGRPSDTDEGAVPDLYGKMLQRNAESDDKDLKILIGQAWTVLPDAVGKDMKDLVESDVDLLFPEEASFKVLRNKLLKNPRLFRSNQLNEPAMDTGEDFYVNNFTEENIRAAMVDISWLPKSGKRYIFWDTALTAGRRSDYSAAAVFQIEERYNDDPVAWLVDAVYDHFTSTSLCQRIVSLTKRWAPECTFIEELPSTTDLFKKAIQEQKLLQGTDDFPIFWFRPDSAAKSKETRIKSLELLLTSGRWKIVVGAGTNASTYIDELMKQLIGYTGHKTNKNHISGRKDDLCDACGYCYKVMPSRMAAAPTEEQKKAEEAIRQKQLDDRRYQAYFSGVMGSPAGLGSQFIVREGSNSTAPVNAEGEAETNPIYRALNVAKHR